jgi:4-amino-4-deoxy-L-arabinose transferase-like glycosyltransferase
MKSLTLNNILLFTLLAVYTLLTIICFNNGYFWDNIQQTSKEAHWFYLNNFSSLLMPKYGTGAEIVGTGYHPPLIGIMTALLWKLFGYKLWVSHAFVLIWALLLVFNSWKLVQFIFPEKKNIWLLLILLLEPTVLTQFAIASPDFILLTAFILTLRGILEQKPVLLGIGVFFLGCINMRGVFTLVILIIVHTYYLYLQSVNKLKFQDLLKAYLPYLPTLFILTSYFAYYLANRGWFFSNFGDNQHYSTPVSVGRIISHFAEFGLRSIENGRVFLWILAFYSLVLVWKYKLRLSPKAKVLLLFFLLQTGLYFLFIFISQMPFSPRYFMPQFFVLSILTFTTLSNTLKHKSILIISAVVLLFELTGHLWIYPEKVAKSWENTLAHLPYYELREACFNYIDSKKIDYNEIDAGFCLYGNRCFVELKNGDKIIAPNSQSNYYIYSNISNIEDSFAENLRNPLFWTPMKKFQKGFVYITLYKKTAKKG